MCAGKKKCDECAQKAAYNNCGGGYNNCGGCSGVDGFDNSIGSWVKQKIVDPITTAKNNAIQNITTTKNDALQNLQQQGIVRTTGGFVKTSLFGSQPLFGGNQPTDAAGNFSVPTDTTSPTYVPAPSSGIGTGGIIAIVAGVLILGTGIFAVVKYVKKKKAA